jgi:hypothetical protein
MTGSPLPNETFWISRLKIRSQPRGADTGAQLMDEKDLANGNAMESEIRAAQMAVSHYRAALLLESAIFDNGL